VPPEERTLPRKRNHEENDFYPKDRRKWYRYSFPPRWWELIHALARLHGYNEATLWKFILITLRRAYPDDWQRVVKGYRLEDRERDLDE
jgi:hypothetical protein